MKMTRRVLGLVMAAILAMAMSACDSSTCASVIECGLVGEWKNAEDSKLTIEFTASSTYTSKYDGDIVTIMHGTDSVKCEDLVARSVNAGVVTIFDKDEKYVVETIRYYFDNGNLYLDGAKYERKN